MPKVPPLPKILSPKAKSLNSSRGFTLVELMVVIAVIGILIGIAVLNLPGVTKSARDAQRASDLRQLSTILERYKTQNEAYPLSDSNYEVTNHPWGSLWTEYNYRVPQDPLPSQKYTYISDGQTFELYAKFENPGASGMACKTPCGPDGSDNGGLTGGTGAALIAWNTGSASSTGGGGGGGAVIQQPSGPVAPIIPGATTYNISGGKAPYFKSMSLTELDPKVGSSDTISVVITDTANVTSATAVIKTDNGVRTFPLTLSSGTAINGTWTDTFVVADTHNSTYVINLRATDSAGNSSSDAITIR